MLAASSSRAAGVVQVGIEAKAKAKEGTCLELGGDHCAKSLSLYLVGQQIQVLRPPQ